jgi:hypothetical protein
MPTDRVEPGNPFHPGMRVSAITRYVCGLCGSVVEVARGLLETGAQVKRCDQCDGKGKPTEAIRG